MSTLDFIILGATLMFALAGYARGFVVGALTLIGFAVGALAGSRIAGALLAGGPASPYTPAFGLFGALVGGGILALGLHGLATKARIVMRLPGLRLLDGILGAALSACVALGIAWALGAAALQAPATAGLRLDIQRSQILQRLDALLPPSGSFLNALARFDPLPAIAGPAAGVPPPTSAIARSGPVRRAFPSVVRVLGSACGLGVEGSGWIAAPGEVVTNAHVVAGEQDTVVQVGGRPPDLPARVVLFDARNDIAVLRVGELAGPSLQLASSPPAGLAAAIVGYPENGPLEARAGRIGPTQTVLADDAYGRGPVSRLLTLLRGLVRPGNSGGPMIDASGRVVTTVFAATTGGAQRGGFGVANAVVSRELVRAGPSAVSTGPCGG
ncbi:MAG: MarP family serine protease [Solirubrobacteraceae bacterium]